MNFILTEFGFNPGCLNTGVAEAKTRLEQILTDKVMRFNPYSVDDVTLLECAERGVLRGFPALTQMLIYHFHDVRVVKGRFNYEAIFLHVGNNPEELHISLNRMACKASYVATRKQMRPRLNGKPLTNYEMVDKMQGKSYFISNALQGTLPNGSYVPLNRLFRLRGSKAKQAQIIRQSMIAAKIEMLREVMIYPFCREYLNCKIGLFDYVSPIRKAVEVIRTFPDINYSPPLITQSL